MPTAPAVDTSDDLERILTMAERARRAFDSSLWRTDLDAAVEAHGDACEALWAELYRLLDDRNSSGDPVPAAKPTRPDLIAKNLKRKFKKELLAELPGMVRSAIENL
jgi:hypothetical protein